MSDDTNTGLQAAEIYFKLRCVRRLDGDCLSCVTDRPCALELETSERIFWEQRSTAETAEECVWPVQPACS